MGLYSKGRGEGDAYVWGLMLEMLIGFNIWGEYIRGEEFINGILLYRLALAIKK